MKKKRTDKKTRWQRARTPQSDDLYVSYVIDRKGRVRRWLALKRWLAGPVE